MTLAITGLADTTVAENVAFTSWTPGITGTPIGDVTWSFSGADSAAFSVEGATGVLSMVARDYEAPADADTNNVYEVTLEAEDADENRAEKAIAVSVTDVTEVETQEGFSDGDLRLVDGNTPNEGRLEIYHNGKWGTIVDDYWTDFASEVACWQLGYTAGSVGNAGSLLPSPFKKAADDMPQWLDDIRCSGDESKLTDCKKSSWGEHNARVKHTEDVALRCALRRPRVQDVPALSGPGSDMTYGHGDTVEVTLSFSEEVLVDTEGGIPTVGILLGTSTERDAGFARGAGTSRLVFTYPVLASDGSHEYARVPQNSLKLNGGAIYASDAHGGNVVLTHAGAERAGSSTIEFTGSFAAYPSEHNVFNFTPGGAFQRRRGAEPGLGARQLPRRRGWRGCEYRAPGR